MPVLPCMDLYQYSCFCEEITLKSGNCPHKNRTNKMHICTFIVFNEQKLKWDMHQAEYDGERERKGKKCQKTNRQDDRKDRQTFRMLISLSFEMFCQL